MGLVYHDTQQPGENNNNNVSIVIYIVIRGRGHQHMYCYLSHNLLQGILSYCADYEIFHSL